MLTRETLDKVAHIARLRLDDGERDALLRDLRTILEMVEQMREVDVSHVESLTHITAQSQRLRDDAPDPAINRAALMDNAPEQDENLFVVPKVIE